MGHVHFIYENIPAFVFAGDTPADAAGAPTCSTFAVHPLTDAVVTSFSFPSAGEEASQKITRSPAIPGSVRIVRTVLMQDPLYIGFPRPTDSP
jgi:hypothetical protein